MKYQLLLKEFLRYTERANLMRERQDLMRAVEIMLVVPKSADDMMNVGRLNGFPGKLTAQGKLIKQGILLFCDFTPILTNLDQSKTADILNQFEMKQLKAQQAKATLNSQQQLQQQQSNVQVSKSTSGNVIYSSSSISPLSAVASQRDTLNSTMIGASQMTDQDRIVLNHLLLSNQVKLKERQTFLFEQTIIFSEVTRKSSNSNSQSNSSSSGGSGSGHNNYQAPNSNYHPCYPHSHNAHGAIESCCTQTDCNMAQTASNYCDRLFDRGNDERADARSDHSQSYATSPSPAQLRRESAAAATLLSLSGNNTHHSHPNHHHHLISASNQYNTSSSTSSSIPPYYSMPSYEYKNHLSINKIALIDKHYGPTVDYKQIYQLLADSLDGELESRRFMLKSRDPNQDNVIYLLQTGCAVDRDDWVCSIRSMLECQLDFLRALQSPIAYQRGLTKEG